MLKQPDKKRIAYVLTSFDAARSGVYNKILDQVVHWKSSGYSVQLFVITDEKSVVFWKNIDSTAVILLNRNQIEKCRNRFKVIQFEVETNPSIIYLRDSFPIRIPRSLIPVVIEVQSLVGQELLIRSRLKYHFFKLTKKYIYSRIAGAVYVSRELLKVNEFEVKEDIPKITVSNGINLSRINSLPQRTEDTPGLLFVGNPNQSWNGIAELIEFGEKNPDINIHIVGEIGETSLSNVFFYGLLSSIEYRSIADKCIAGVGTLNLKAKKMQEASPLKVREYLALGLPVILKYHDSDLNSRDPHVLQLPPDGRPLAAFESEIRSFLEEWAKRRVSNLEILDLDVANKESARLEFFEEIMHKKSVRG
jgi:hypothetical protein